MSLSLFDQTYGCLMGVAMGDALGMPASGFDHRRAAQIFQGLSRRRRLSYLPAPSDHPYHAGLGAGDSTDDTEVLLLLLRAGLRPPGLNEETATAALLTWAERTNALQSPLIGPSTRQALQKLQCGTSPAEAGREGNTDGAALRGIAAALLSPGDPGRAADAAMLASVPTHGAAAATGAAAAVAAWVAVVLGGGGRAAATRQALEWARKGESCGQPVPGPSLPARLDWALGQAGHRPGRRGVRLLREVIGAGVHAAESIPFTFGALAAMNWQPRESLLAILMAGDDADSNAALAGAMLGALYGAEALLAVVEPPADGVLRPLRELAGELAAREQR